MDSTIITNYVSPFFIRIMVAVVIILFGFIIGKIAGKLLQRFLHEIELNKLIKKATKIRVSLEKILSNLVSYLIYFIAVIMALKQVGFATDILNILAGAIMIIIILSIFLSIKDFIPNFIAGLFIHRKGFIKEGDKIKVRDIKGKIIFINLVETRIKTGSGDIIYVPNSMLTKYEVVKLKK